MHPLHSYCSLEAQLSYWRRLDAQGHSSIVQQRTSGPHHVSTLVLGAVLSVSGLFTSFPIRSLQYIHACLYFLVIPGRWLGI